MPYTGDTIDRDIELYAAWTPIETHRLTFNYNLPLDASVFYPQIIIIVEHGVDFNLDFLEVPRQIQAYGSGRTYYFNGWYRSGSYPQHGGVTSDIVFTVNVNLKAQIKKQGS